jgi:ribosomal protein S18 acetylase RimI-like enzyme
MIIYKVSPLRESLLFEPSVFYRTTDFRSSSTRPKRLRQAGIECAHQTYRRSDMAFRPLTAAEEAAGYQVICDTVDWLREKGIKLWETPLPREAYAARQQRGENYGLFVGGELAGVVSLVRGAAQQWAEELPDRRIMWMSTLTTANAFRGRGLGRQIVEQAIAHLAVRGETMLYLDCTPGFLVELYSEAGFEKVARKTVTINRGSACYHAEAVLMRRNP